MTEMATQNEISNLLTKMKERQQVHEKLLKYVIVRTLEASEYRMQLPGYDTPIDPIYEMTKTFFPELLLSPYQSKAAFNEEDAKIINSLNPEESKYLKQFAEHGLIATSRPMFNVCRLIDIYADRDDIGILITGPSGSGKQVVAETIHRKSKRADGPFIDFNCGAIAATLAESELFGIDKGVATGVDERKGTIRHAHNGTLFLDEIGNMSMSVQGAMLKVIDSGEVFPVGGENKYDKVDVRYISGTNADLEEKGKNNEFRVDFYNRIAGTEIPIPALNKRPADIPLLAMHFFNESWSEDNLPFKISQKTFKLLQRMAWPGNVRELRSHIRRVVAVVSYYRAQMTPTLFRMILKNPDPSAMDDMNKTSNAPSQLANDYWELLEEYITSKYNDSETGKRVNMNRDTVKTRITSIFLRLGYHRQFDPGTIFNHLYELGYLDRWQKEDFIDIVQKRYTLVTNQYNKPTSKSLYYQNDEPIVKALIEQFSSTSK